MIYFRDLIGMLFYYSPKFIFSFDLYLATLKGNSSFSTSKIEYIESDLIHKFRFDLFSNLKIDDSFFRLIK